MVTSKDVETLYDVNPFGGGMPDEDVSEEEYAAQLDAACQEMEDLGMDYREINEWAMEKMPKLFVGLARAGVPPALIPAGTFVSGIRIGFLLGRGYVED